jgi:hypothetical protein
MKNENYKLIVLSCDKNEDLWPLFFKFFKKNWESFSGSILLNTESKSYNHEGLNIERIDQSFNSNHNWSYRFIQNLSSVEEEFVLLLMDDYFLNDKVDTKKVNEALEFMERDSNIACINFLPTNKEYKSDTYLGDYVLVPKNHKFRMNLQAAVWRKTTLLKYIRRHENPWQFEIWGSIRIKRYNHKIYHLQPQAKKVFIYHTGGVIADGKWRGKEVCDFLYNEGYELDYNIRGIYEAGDERKTQIKKRNIITKIVQVLKSLI